MIITQYGVFRVLNNLCFLEPSLALVEPETSCKIWHLMTPKDFYATSIPFSCCEQVSSVDGNNLKLVEKCSQLVISFA